MSLKVPFFTLVYHIFDSFIPLSSYLQYDMKQSIVANRQALQYLKYLALLNCVGGYEDSASYEEIENEKNAF